MDIGSPQAWDKNQSFAFLTSTFNKHDCNMGGDPEVQPPEKPALRQRFACRTLGGKCSQDQFPWWKKSEQRRKMPSGFSILWSCGSAMVPQRCYDHNTSLGPFCLSAIKQSFFTSCCREGLTLYRARWLFSWEQGNQEGAWTETDITLPSQHLGGATQQMLIQGLWSQEMYSFLS